MKARFVTFGVNDNYQFGPDVLYAADPRWIDYHEQQGNIPTVCRKYTCRADRVEKWGWNYVHVLAGRGEGISLDPMHMHSGGNTGFQLINLAVLMGVARIVLLGYDMRLVSGKDHWFGNHPPEVNATTPNPGKYQKWAPHFGTMRPQLKEAGVEVINCTKDSAIKAFPYRSLTEVLNGD